MQLQNRLHQPIKFIGNGHEGIDAGFKHSVQIAMDQFADITHIAYCVTHFKLYSNSNAALMRFNKYLSDTFDISTLHQYYNLNLKLRYISVERDIFLRFLNA